MGTACPAGRLPHHVEHVVEVKRRILSTDRPQKVERAPNSPVVEKPLVGTRGEVRSVGASNSNIILAGRIEFPDCSGSTDSRVIEQQCRQFFNISSKDHGGASTILQSTVASFAVAVAAAAAAAAAFFLLNTLVFYLLIFL